MSLAKAKIKLWDWIVFYGIPIVLLLLYVLLGPYRAHGQTNGQSFPNDNGPYQSGQHIVLPQNAVPMIPQASVFPTQGTGSTQYFYWIVTHDVTNSRFSIPAGPFFTNIGPASLSATQTITVQWPVFALPFTYGQSSPNATPFTTSSVTYDVLRTATGTPPSGACACAVATGLTVSNVADTGTLGAYTVNVPAWPGNYPKAGNVAGFGPLGILIDGGTVIPAASIAGFFTVATLPASPAVNTLAIVTDGFGGITSAGTGNNCISGGGTTTALCRWTGTVWKPDGGVIPSFGSSSCINSLLWLDNSGIIECTGLGSPDGLYFNFSARELQNGAHASTAGFPYAALCTDCTTGSLTGVLVSQGKDASANPTAYTEYYTKVTNNTAGAVAAEVHIAIANGGTFTPPPGITPPDSIRILPNGQIFFVGQTSGGAQVGSAAVGGTPNPMNWPTTTGAAGAILQTDGNNPQQLSWKPTSLQNPVQAYSITTQSADVPLTGSVAAVTITHAVTMPTSGCPCRVLANWAQYMVTTGSAVVAEEWVRDGSVNFAEAEWPIDVNNGPSGTGSGMSPNTYANNAVVTFTLNVEVDGSSVTAKAAPFHAFGLRNSRLELTVIPSN